MSLFGVGKGLLNVIVGVIEGDSEKIIEGAAKTVKSSVMTLVTGDVLKSDDDDLG